jgi:steroid delta-isomerase-like uncharacterized protein
MNTDPKSVVMDWTDAVNRHDPDAAAQYFSDDCVFTNVGTGRHAEGRPAVREEFAALLTRWSDVHVETINILINDGRFTKEWTMSGVHSDGLPATGRSFRIRGAGVGQIRDGKIVELTEYWNMAEFLTQVGAMPPAGPLSTS